MLDSPARPMSVRPLRSLRRLVTTDLYVYGAFLILSALLVLAHRLGLT
jgi:hypothetical protein